MKSRKLYFIVLTLFISIYFFNITNSYLDDRLVNYFQILSAITALIGVYAIWYQLKRDKDINEAQFLIDLNAKFYDNESIMIVYSKCIKYLQKLDEETIDLEDIFTIDDEIHVSQYLSFFGTINNLIEKEILDLHIIDKTFGYRYFSVTNNPQIQDLFLIPDAKYYRGNYALYKKWYEYRKKSNLPIVLEKNILMERYPEGFVKHESKVFNI